MQNITVKSSDVLTYLNVKHPTFLSWIRAGMLGEEHLYSGRGIERHFTFIDIVTFSLIKKVLSLSNNTMVAQKAAATFRGVADKKIIEVLKGIETGEYKRTLEYGKPNLIISRSSNDIKAEFYSNKFHWLRDKETPEAILIVPIDRIIKEALEVFPQFQKEE